MIRGREYSAEAPRIPAEDGLLTRFLQEKLAEHVEPTRLGTPRGAPVGFSRRKLAAALLALTSADVKEAAKEARVSYGLVRKWRTEAAFKALVDRLEEQFVERFCAAVDAEAGPLLLWDSPASAETAQGSSPPVGIGPMDRERDARGPGWAEGNLDTAGGGGEQRLGLRGADVDQIVQVLSARRTQWFTTNLGDFRRYGPRLIRKLAQRLLDEGDGVGRLGRMSALQGLSALRHEADPSPDLERLGISALVGMLRFIVRALESPAVSGAHRHIALVYLGMLQRQLSDRRA